ncbi:NADPH-dependent F420 reductase [Nocardia iowensis]|uniref:NAD(P)-binding domain-containing protein n=1 Tax=Nocardia iowensis TaxID=204891 RepID=A0ABX8S3P0_NOCIO|nr:NAD(P)-binding domain-containing protein [Nocardia iowensis]QXN94516.1 NAD(P)-binding domain-containing protein [Nocardia iowensis]
MRFAILGTGAGARAHTGKLLQLGHDVVVGTRDRAATLARTEPDMMGTPPYREWLEQHPMATLLPFAEAAAHGEVIINGISGDHALATLAPLTEQLRGKPLLDYAVPYVYNPARDHPWPTPWGVMPALNPCDSDSLGEQIQRALPATQVVKVFVTQEQETVVDPKAIEEGDHTMFLAGDHDDAKAVATQLLHDYGWTHIVDLGPLVSARGMEMYAHLHTAVGFALGRRFGVKIV